MGELHPGSARWEEREWLRSQPREWWDDVFDRIACGESAAKVVKEGYCVRVAMFLRVLDEDPEKRSEYERALAIAADSDAHSVVDIADAATPEDAAVAKVRIAARQWRTSKWNRERYGEKVDVRHGGAVGGLTIVLAQLAPGEQEKVVSPERVGELEDQTGTAAGEDVQVVTPGRALLPSNPPRQAVPVPADIGI